MITFGLIGHRLGYSFSKKYFTDKFEKLKKTDHEYLNFELDSIDQFPEIFEKHKYIMGLNCTIPYKQEIMQFMHEIDAEAAAVGAVNTIKILNSDGKRFLKGFNTDVVGFRNSLKPMLKPNHTKALILGTGGASKAIKHVLTGLGIEYISASIEEKLESDELRYEDITASVITERQLIINATPLGTFPNVDACPSLPYCSITPDHILFDLVYNPELTKFLKKGKEKKAQIKNGLEMLHGQAEAAWDIWNR
jgi:shikimate dehydrogenase